MNLVNRTFFHVIGVLVGIGKLANEVESILSTDMLEVLLPVGMLWIQWIVPLVFILITLPLTTDHSYI
jgi:hypothetical protein